MVQNGDGTKARVRYFRDSKKTKKAEKVSAIVWNVAGLNNKDEEFWEEVKKHESIGLTETWVEKVSPKIEKKWGEGHEWTVVKARREARKGRAKGGIVVGVKKGWNAKIEVRSSDIVEISLKMSNKKWVIYIVYLRENKTQITFLLSLSGARQ